MEIGDLSDYALVAIKRIFLNSCLTYIGII